MSTLRNLRERKGLTVSQLAAKAGISSRVIAEYEEGRSAITLPHAKILAKALWVGIEDILPRAGAVTEPSSYSQSSVVPPAPQAVPRPVPVPTPTPATSPAPSAPPSTQSPSQAVAQSHHANGPVPAVDVQRPPRSSSAGAGPHVRNTDGKGPSRSTPKVAAPPSAISEGQMQELGRLAVKLEIDIAQLEERLGKKLSDMTRPEAKEWIKRVRAMAEEIAPNKRAYGQWPGGQVDLEAQYLAAQKEAQAHFTFKLFNGEDVSGLITDFTPYTITIAADPNGGDLVLRKLAIAYYKRTAVSEAPSPPAKRTRQPKAKAEAAPKADVVVPTDAGIDSDRAGEPVTPETDNMDEDRGV